MVTNTANPIKWDNPPSAYETGDLFLGVKDGREIGIRTERHAITFAGARSGKGACVIIPNLKRWPHNVLVIDPKGENAEKTWQDRQAMGKSVHVLDPFNSADIPDEIRAAFNPLEHIDPEDLTAGSDLKILADGLVKRHDPRHAQWDDGAVKILAGVMAYVISDAPPEKRTLTAMRDVLVQTKDDLHADAQRMMAVGGCDGLAKNAGLAIMTAFESEKSMEADYLNAARTHTEWIDIGAFNNVLNHSTFDLSAIKNGNASVYLVLPVEYLDTHGAFLRLFVRTAINAMAKGGSGKGEECLFILDEFFSLGKIDAIAKASGAMPSYGVHLWPILQDLGQLIDLYGNAQSQTFFGNADLHQFFGNTDKMTLELMSHLTGIVSIDDIGEAPNAPAMMGGGPSMIAAATAHSKDSVMRGTGAAVGAITSGIGQAINASVQAHHQNEMAEFQRKMATVGRARLTPEEIAKLVQKKSDQVADNMFCITFGSDKFLLKPAPYFRPSEPLVPDSAKQTNPTVTEGNRLSKALKYAGIYALFGVVLSLGLSTDNPHDEPLGIAFMFGFALAVIGFCVGFFSKSSK